MSIGNSSDMRETNNSPNKSDNLLVFWGLVVLLFVIWFFSPFIMCGIKLLTGFDGSTSYESINSLFSGWAFAGVIYTIILQRKELSLQREELFRSRIEYEKQSLIMEKQLLSIRQNDDFNKYIKHMEVEPRFAINDIIQKNESQDLIILNIGCEVYNFTYETIFTKDQMTPRLMMFGNMGLITVSIPRYFPESGADTIEITVLYNNKYNYQISRVVIIDLKTLAFKDKSNSFVDSLQVDFFLK
jgi:hypothetical protein